MSQEKAQLIAPIGHFTVPGLNVAGVVTATSFSGNCTGTASSITKGASLVVGVMTASSFVGDVTGNVTGIGSNTDNLDVGVVTATSFAGNFTGIGSGLTGTPNVVAGVVTATKFVGNTPGTVSKLADGTNINVGVITATKFVGNTPGLAGGISAAQNINVGVLTATGGLFGDGSGLTGAGSTAYIRQDVTAQSGTTTINLNDGNIIYLTHSNNTTIAFSNVKTADDVTIITTTTDKTITWPSTSWNGGTAPTLLSNTRSNAAQVFNLITCNGGTNWYGYEEVNSDPQDMEVYMWGYGHEGALAQNSQASYSSPIQIPGTTWSNICRRSPKRAYHSLATKTDGTLWIWGWNELGTLGQNAPYQSRRSSPVQIPGTWGKDADLLAGNQWTAAIKTDGTLWTWGDNRKGQLGHSNVTEYSSPVQVPGTTWSKIDGAEEFGYNLALKTDGTLWSWGYSRTTRGLLGLGDTNRRSSPTQIPGTTWSDVGAGIYSAGAVRSDGTLWVWGHNWAGCLGLNQAHDNTKYSSPKQVPGTNWSKIRSGFYNMAAIKTDGTLWTWGSNSDGRDGTNSGQNTDRSSPVQVPGTTWSDVWCGGHGSGGIKTDGTIWSWGYNFQGMLGQNQAGPTKVSSPIQIPGTWGKFEGGWQAMATKAP